MTLTNSNSNVDENLGGLNLGNQVVEPSQTSSEIQAWTEIFEQKNNDRVEKMREEMENKLDTILKEIKSNRSHSTVTNPRSQVNGADDMRPSGSRSKEPIGVHASNMENSEPEDEDNPIKASKKTELKHPAKPLFRSESDVDVTIHSDEESDAESVEDYHKLEWSWLNFVITWLKIFKPNDSTKKLSQMVLGQVTGNHAIWPKVNWLNTIGHFA